MDIQKLIQSLLKQGFTGTQIDIFARAVGGSLLNEEKPVFAIPLNSFSSLISMLENADSYHLLVEGGIFYFCALYSLTEKFPAPRIYFMKTSQLFEVPKISVALEKQGYKFIPIHSNAFSNVIDKNGYKDRYISWRNHFELKHKPFKNLFEGRKQNTIVKEAFWLSTDGCFICGEKADVISTTSIMGEEGLMFGIWVCKQHEQEAHDNTSLLEYIAKKANISLPFAATQKLSRSEMLTMTVDTLQDELGCTIEKIVGSAITAIRPSGLRIILRQDNLNNYAYNFEWSNENRVARIDSANHHSINYGPDHIHRSLKKKEKNKVEPSFTYGFAPFDIQVIKNLIEEAESSLCGNQLCKKESANLN